MILQVQGAEVKRRKCEPSTFGKGLPRRTFTDSWASDTWPVSAEKPRNGAPGNVGLSRVKQCSH